MSSPTGSLTNLVPFREAVRTWWLISWQTFGGPAGQIAVMHRVLVEQKRWVGEQRFLYAVNYCMLLPGPEAQQLAIYVGWLLNGIRGGLVAGVLFVIPGLISLLALSALYIYAGESPVLSALFIGLSAAVFAIVVQAVLRVASRALITRPLKILAFISFSSLAVFHLPFPVVIALAALIGWLLSRTGRLALPPPKPRADGVAPVVPDTALSQAAPGLRRSVRVLLVGVVLWLGPIFVAAAFLGRNHILVDQGKFFSGAAMVTFGGAYAVLAYVAQRAVETYGWLSATEMTKGLALAESTPGPLIIVVQFVAFLGAYRNPGELSPWVAAVLAALLTSWVTFAPCFIWIFLGAPYVERLRSNTALTAALTGISAAVVGVIAQLAVYFAIHTFFSRTFVLTAGIISWELPIARSVQWGSVAIAAGACLLIFWRGWPLLRVLFLAAGIGLSMGLIGLG